MNENLLTTEQREARALARIDLATGYPMLQPTPGLLEAWPLLNVHPKAELNSSSEGFEERISRSLGRLLGVHDIYHDLTQLTFSGSVALQRAMVALQILAESMECDGIELIVIEPCIDIYRSIAKELGISLVVIDRFAASEEKSWLEQVADAAFDATLRGNFSALVIDTPSNPYGTILSWKETDFLEATMSSSRGIIIYDYCFAIAGSQLLAQVPLTFQRPEAQCHWLAIWDTGKTFDLSGEKMAVIISSSSAVLWAVEKSLESIQVGYSLSSQAFFAKFLESEFPEQMLGVLGRCVTENQFALSESALAPRWREAMGGTFAVLEFDPEKKSTEIRQWLLSTGVAVSSGAAFRALHRENPTFIRLSLARETQLFSEGLALVETLAKELV